MNVKGFIIEDDQGREVMMVCEQLHVGPMKTFVLRGWQRRRLVPLEYTEHELHQILNRVAITLNDLIMSLPRNGEESSDEFSNQARVAAHMLRERVGGGEAMS
ncbi:MAG: hypothetical protein HP491_19020 [Nitrospira sp.]|nr:hypothetical protein [Nitrospira sp.]MBH0181660.1 hypothetical protein [Nitrospira sp.]MBH0184243.1 hypothetical protein [Nitrospira sp.]MBH0197258.1 hypothetical protein [Nitrospira sp.]